MNLPNTQLMNPSLTYYAKQLSKQEIFASVVNHPNSEELVKLMNEQVNDDWN